MDEKAQEVHLVTGGCGYAGYHLGLALSKRKHKVILLDIVKPDVDIPENVSFVKVDIRDYEKVKATFDGVSCVYHLASYGISGLEQLNRQLIEQININGTENVIKACKEQGINRLVYTSTFQVVYGGQVIENGDETLPYFPIDKQCDDYTRTKTIAEQKILNANDTHNKNGEQLKTCALRPAGIYGPGEKRMLSRLMHALESGNYVEFGDYSPKLDFIHIDNFVQAHILANEGLCEKNHFVAAGQSYFITDGAPINCTLFFHPLIKGLGYSIPSYRAPVSLVYFFAFLIEWIHYIVGRFYQYMPLLTRKEIENILVTHWFNISKACAQLGYNPIVQNDLESCVQWYKERGYGKTCNTKQTYSLRQFISHTLFMTIFVCIIMYFYSKY